MTYYERISHNYRFGRIYDHLIYEYMPEDIGKIVQYLVSEHGLAVEGIYLENYKSPDLVIVMNGKLPMHDIAVNFRHMKDIRFAEGGIVSDRTYSSLEGKLA